FSRRQSGHDLFQPVAVAIYADDRVAVRGEPGGDRRADPAGGTGDDDRPGRAGGGRGLAAPGGGYVRGHRVVVPADTGGIPAYSSVPAGIATTRSTLIRLWLNLSWPSTSRMESEYWPMTSRVCAPGS